MLGSEPRVPGPALDAEGSLFPLAPGDHALCVRDESVSTGAHLVALLGGRARRFVGEGAERLRRQAYDGIELAAPQRDQ